MQYLTIKKHSRPRKDGREHAQAFIVTKDRKYGKEQEKRCLSTQKSVLITGAHASGKTRWLDRLHAEAARVWPARTVVPLKLSATASIAEWTHGQHLELWWAGREGNGGQHWSKLKPFEREAALPDYLQETGAVLFLDDANHLTSKSKKCKIAEKCLAVAQVWVMTSKTEGALPPTMRQSVVYTDPQVIRLESDVSYDATPIFIWGMVALLASMGMMEFAMALAGLKMLSGGRLATKQA